MHSLETPARVSIGDVLDLVDIVVVTISRRLPLSVSREDLTSVGKVALMTCLPAYDGSLDEVRAYCFVKIRGAILDELRRLDPVPRNVRKRIREVQHAEQTLRSRLNHVPTNADIAAEAGLSIKRTERTLQVIASLEPPDPSALNTVRDDSAVIPSDELERADLRAALASVLGRLPAAQGIAVRRFCLDDYTLEQIGDELDVSTERARQIRDAGVKKLRAEFAVLGLWQATISRHAQAGPCGVVPFPVL